MRAGAPEQTQEDGLGAVVGVVGGRDARDPDAGGLRAKGDEARRAGAGLEVAAGCDGDAGAPERHLELAGEGFRPVELSRGLRSQPVVDAVREQLVADGAAQAGQHVEQGHRIGASAHGREHACSPSEQPFVDDGAAGNREQGGGVRPHGSSSRRRPSSNSLQKTTVFPVASGGGR